MTFKLVSLHERLDIKELCCKLLNSEWKRSDGARLWWLEQSNYDFPCNLVMLENDNNEIVIGHARLTCVVGDEHALYVSSVIISKERRGSGLGKRLMELLELYAVERKFKVIHLRTDKPIFYKKCGYETSTPIEQCTGKALQAKILAFQKNQNNLFNSTIATTKLRKQGEVHCTELNSNTNTFLKSMCQGDNSCSLSNQQCLEKSISSSCQSDELDEPNCCRNSIFWMKKRLY